MSEKEVIFTPEAPTPLGTYSQAVIVPAGARIVKLCGQIPLTKDGKLILDSIENQTRQVFTNICEVVKAVGGDTSQVVKLNVFLTNMDDLKVVNQIMPEFFSKPYPARSAIGVASLVANAGIEIDGEMFIK